MAEMINEQREKFDAEKHFILTSQLKKWKTKFENLNASCVSSKQAEQRSDDTKALEFAR